MAGYFISISKGIFMSRTTYSNHPGIGKEVDAIDRTLRNGKGMPADGRHPGHEIDGVDRTARNNFGMPLDGKGPGEKMDGVDRTFRDNFGVAVERNASIDTSNGTPVTSANGKSDVVPGQIARVARSPDFLKPTTMAAASVVKPTQAKPFTV